MDRVRAQVGLGDQCPYDGSGVVIAVLDTGVSAHPDLAGSVLLYRDFVGGRTGLWDDNGHGTHVCGILCGSGKLSRGRYRGMAPGAKLIVGKVLDQRGEGRAEDMLKALRWIGMLSEQMNIRILNLSVGVGDLIGNEKCELICRQVERLQERGILIVCAAGNRGPMPGTLSRLGENSAVLTVGCHDGEYHSRNPKRCETYSGAGALGRSRRKPDLVAPGTMILSCNGAYRGGKLSSFPAYVAKSGTSMAAPIVAGGAALLFQKEAFLTEAECRRRLMYSAKDLRLPWNRQGFGLLNLEKLLGESEERRATRNLLKK